MSGRSGPGAGARHIKTMGLTFGAYRGRAERRGMSTHSWEVQGGDWVPLCDNVSRNAYALNDSPAEDQAPPTCRRCLRFDPRFDAEDSAHV